MRKIITVALALMLLAGLCTTAAAAENTLAVANASAQTGQTVFLSVTLNESVTADSVALTYSYDPSLLQAIPGSCEWSVKGDLDNFNNKNAGVWATGAAKPLSGELCILAFHVLEDAKLKDTKVSVTVSMKKNEKVVGSFDAKGTVSITCGHIFGVWSYQDLSTHSRECGTCGEVQTGSHSWDSGVLKKNPQNAATQLKVFTCQACGGTKELEVEGSYREPEATGQTEPDHTHVPVQTMPTTFPQPETRPVYTPPEPSEVTHPVQTTPTHDHTHEQITVPYVDYNAPDDAHTAPTDPMYLPVETLTGDDAHAGHDHTAQPSGPKWVTAVVTFVAVIALGGGAVFYVRKMRR